MKVKAFLLLCLLACQSAWAQKKYGVSSPDGQVKVDIRVDDKVYYDVTSHGEKLFSNSHLGLALQDGKLPAVPQVQGVKQTKVSETIKPVFALKAAEMDNTYNLLTMTMRGGYAIEWRVYNDAVAYRFVTNLKGDIEVKSEDCTVQLTGNTRLTLQQTDWFKTSCEEYYSNVQSAQWARRDRMSELPLVIAGESQKVLMSEFDLFDYPGMFVTGNSDNSLNAIHPRLPIAFGDDGDRSVKITEEAPYIAKTKGTRTFPWRFFYITQDDKQLANCTMPMRLAPKSVIGDTSWIKPGKTTWEWWNGSIPYGPDVNFRSGLNIETYKYFVDFAQQNGLEYILMDEGWAKSTRDPFTPNPDIDLQELIRYAKSKNVGIILWLTWLTVDRNMSLFETFEKWGIAGVKIDFMDRQDQWMVNFYERTAKAAADHHLFVDFHGAYHPSGMEYKYPNVLSFEGVRGMEQMGGCVPNNSVYLPFIRNAVGPMDYTPGAMLCAQPFCYRSERPNSVSIGTKAYQMALFVLFESHIQMMADNPSLYNMFPDCRDYIAAMPVNWDETRVLAAEFGQYVVTAKRKGDKWYIGGMTNENGRDLTVNLDFLTDGKAYQMTSFVDGINADVQAMDYRKVQSEVRKGAPLRLKMARNGGFAAILEP